MQDDYLPHLTQLVHRVFPKPPVLAIERVGEGVSTYVYRISRAEDVLYLRVLPEPDASFGPEALVHQVLRARGVQVPDVVYYEHRYAPLERSVMVTTEIPGRAVGYGTTLAEIADLLRQAGKDLALINQVEVDGFGWIRRDDSSVSQLRGEFSTFWTWIQQDVQLDFALLERSHLFRPQELLALSDVFDRCRTLFTEGQAYLAHGDFDVTHVYHEHGTYTGIIDFGEIRGTNALYDLAHFDIENHDLLPYLLEGYSHAAMLPGDYEQRIVLSGLLIALRRLTRRLMKGAEAHPPDVAALKRYLKVLVTIRS